MKKIAVFFGGESNEREISVITGVYAVNLLRSAGYDVLPVYLTEENVPTLFEDLKSVDDVLNFSLKKFKPVRFVRGGICLEKKNKTIPVDCALNCCHGGMGEGGELSALLSWYAIPSASPEMTPSAVFLDKTLAKICLKGLGIPVVPSVALREEEFCEECLSKIEQDLGYPIIVKPSMGGSSLGISVAGTRAELLASLKFCFRIDRAALLEKYLEGKRDFNCAAYSSEGEIILSQVEEVFSKDEILSFREKYESAGRSRSQIPADLPEETVAKIREALLRVYKAFNIRGVVRGDFLLSSGGELYFNELNTVPGTLAAYLFGESLSSAKDFLCSLINACASSPRKVRLSSGILSRQPHGRKSSDFTK